MLLCFSYVCLNTSNNFMCFRGRCFGGYDDNDIIILLSYRWLSFKHFWATVFLSLNFWSLCFEYLIFWIIIILSLIFFFFYIKSKFEVLSKSFKYQDGLDFQGVDWVKLLLAMLVTKPLNIVVGQCRKMRLRPSAIYEKWCRSFLWSVWG